MVLNYFKNNIGSIALALLIVVPIIVYYSLSNKQKEDRIDKSKCRTCGTLSGYSYQGRSSLIIQYEYTVNRRHYEASSKSEKWFTDCMETGWCIGLNFTVEYECGNPQNSRMVWTMPNCSPPSRRSAINARP